MYGGVADPAAALRWLDALWQTWTARYGQDAHMRRHMVVFTARILREAAVEPQKADNAARVLRELSIAMLM